MEISARLESAVPFAFENSNQQLALPLRVHHEGFVGTVHSEGLCTELTTAGFCAEVPAVLRVGEVVQVEMEVPGLTDALQVAARVTYRNHFRYGFYFPTLATTQREGLGRTMRRVPDRSVVVQ